MVTRCPCRPACPPYKRLSVYHHPVIVSTTLDIVNLIPYRTLALELPDHHTTIRRIIIIQ